MISISAIFTLVIVVVAVVLFVTEAFSVDIIALLIVLALVLSGVLSPEEGVAGFSNKATITVMFMYILSASVLKTGVMQILARRLAKIFTYNFTFGMLVMMIFVAIISAFINNTPVVAVFLPIIIEIAQQSGRSPSKMLIPLSFASIFGGACTLVGSSSNILVSGIAEKNGLEGFGMFFMSPFGLILCVVGILYMILLGVRLLPKNMSEVNLKENFGNRKYITEILIIEDSKSAGKEVKNLELLDKVNLDVIKVSRGEDIYTEPKDDFVLKELDVLKVRGNVEELLKIQDQAGISVVAPRKNIDKDDKDEDSVTLLEMIITYNSVLVGRTLTESNFNYRFRAIPQAIQHRSEIQYEKLYDSKLKAGDVILAKVKNRDIDFLKRVEREEKAPFLIISEDERVTFNRSKFILVLTTIVTMITSAALGYVDIMIAAIMGTVFLVLTKVMTMKDAYAAVNWKIIFLLAGALSLGTAIHNSGIDVIIADGVEMYLGSYGPIVVISGLYFITSFLTELISNNAAAALIAPIAITIAHSLGVSPYPLLIAVTFASSASFMTPVGYQTNTMVYSAGQYKFTDFIKIGFFLNIIFWILATLLIPILYPF